MMLNSAKQGRFEDMKSFLVSNPGLVNSRPNGRWSALHQAAYHANRDAIVFLLGIGADVNSTTKSGEIPLDVLPKNAPDSLRLMLLPPTKKKKATVSVVTYNISWAAALQKALGSEAVFVRRMCQPHPHGHCRKNAIRSLVSMTSPASLYGFQEYRPWEEVTNETISSSQGPFVLPPVDSNHLLSPDGTTLRSLFSPESIPVGYVSGIQLSFYSALFTCWDTRVFGDAVRCKCVNLSHSHYDARPCFVSYTSRGFLIVNAHAPQPDTLDMGTVFRRIDDACRQVCPSPPSHVFVTGDFNDTPRALEKGQTLHDLRLNPPGMIRTCCFDPGYGMQGDDYMFTGDYVLSDLVPVSHKRVLPDGKLTQSHSRKPEVGRSDHDPIISTFEI